MWKLFGNSTFRNGRETSHAQISPHTDIKYESELELFSNVLSIKENLTINAVKNNEYFN